VGNLICPAEFPLGAHARMVVVSVTEGPYTLRKHPYIFAEAQAAAINKTDLAPAMKVDLQQLRRDALAIVLSALFFGAGHGYQGLLGLMQTTAAGLALGVLAVWRKSLWPCIGAHLAIDTFGLLVLKALKPFL
jgi:hypothetical protein